MRSPPFLLPMLLLIALVALLPAPGRAEALFETPGGDALAIGYDVQVLEDPGRQLGLDQVRQIRQGWQTNHEAIFNRGYSPSAWWLHFDLHNPHATQHWLLEIAYPPLDHLNVYIVRANGGVESLATGDKLPMDTRPVFHRNYVVPLHLQPDEKIHVYLRLESTGALQAPMTLWRLETFHAHDVGVTILQGLYYGGLIIIALYNLLVFTVLRERYYLYYVGFVMSMCWLMASLNGWAFQFLWPNAIIWNDLSINAAISTCVLFAILFTGTFLGLPAWSPRFHLMHYSGIGISLLIFCGGFLFSYSLMARINISWGILACLWGIVVGIIAIRRRAASARIYVLAWALLLVGTLVMALSKLHFLPRNIFTNNAMQLGSLVEVLLLSFALAERINQERHLRHRAQQEALTVQRKANEELEQRVQDRTLELEAANHKLRELSDTDQLTGLKNRRFLDQYIEQEFGRAQRYRHSIAVLMIDADHFKSVNDRYGHQVGDDCLQEIARRISKEMRWPSDTAARYGGEEFCVVLPETGCEGALTVAERIRQKIEGGPIHTRTLPLSLTVSIGVHVAVPAQGDSLADFFAAADRALYQAKQAGRNRVVCNSA